MHTLARMQRHSLCKERARIDPRLQSRTKSIAQKHVYTRVGLFPFTLEERGGRVRIGTIPIGTRNVLIRMKGKLDLDINLVDKDDTREFSEVIMTLITLVPFIAYPQSTQPGTHARRVELW